MKKLLAMLLAVLMVLSVLPVAAFADEGGAAPVWPAEGSIKLDKDAQAVEGKDNLWEVTLQIQGKNYKTTSDVVLVIDNSNSMYTEKSNSFVEDKNCRMYKTKIAAKAFADALLTENSSTRIAVVVFNLNAVKTGFYTYQNKAELKQYIDAISNDEENGGTFTQLGIKNAQDLLNSAESTGKTKSIVLLSDGVPTKSYQVNRVFANVTKVDTKITSNCGRGSHKAPTIELVPSSYTTEIMGCDYTKTWGNGYESDYDKGYDALTKAYFNHDRVEGSWSCSHLVYGSKTWNYVINANNSNGTSNTTGTITGYSKGSINFSTKFTPKINNLGEPTIWEANQAKAAGTTIYSVALQAGTDGEATLKACASDAAKGYFAIAANETDVAGALTNAFTSIAGSIAIAARNGIVNDTMGEKVDLKFDGNAPVITTDEAVYNAGKADIYISQGTATWDNAARKINWVVGNVSEGDAPTLKYKVTIKAGYNASTNETLETNASATFDYTDYRDKEKKSEFPVPEVTVGGGKILVHYYMVNGKGEPINENGVVVASPSLAKQVKTAEYFAVDGSTGLSYNTPYTVASANITYYTYFGKYNLNNGTLTEGNAATVTLSAANSNQHVWFAYTQEFTVVHVKESGNISETFSVSAGFDMTKHVTSGYLYGGTFDDEACTAVSDFGSGNPTDFMPKAGKTYYIWEVDKAYLTPKGLSGWHSVSSGIYDVNGFYLVAPIDRLLYREVGFTVSSNKNTVPATFTANQLATNNFEDSTASLRYVDGSVVYDTIVMKLKSGSTSSYNIGTYLGESYKGYLACYSLQKDGYWAEQNDTVTYTPYWITLDGVKVTGAKVRTCEYKGEGSEYQNKLVGKISEDAIASTIEYVGEANNEANSLMLASAFIADADLFGNTQRPTEPTEPEQPKPTEPEQPEPTEPTEPEQPDPTEPTEPEQPEPTEPTEPEQPEEPEQPSDEITVTVHDAGETYTVTVAKGDIRGEIEYIGAEGKLFAGWYSDERCKKSAELSDVTEDTEIYAKYVSDSYLQVKYIEDFFFRSRRVYLISAVEGRDFTETGFVINGEAFTASGSNRRVRYSASYLFGRDISRNARLIVVDYPLYGIEEGAELAITPYWVTADGTTVYGTERILTIGWYGIEG